jgi:8-oxo-dGTP diphosphatase
LEQILVTAGFITENGKVLIAQRLPQGPEAGKWEFPGGKVELAEDPRSCLQRELHEELGIEVAVDEVLEVISSVKEQRHLVLIYFRCRIIRGETEAIECQKVTWLTPEQIDPLEKPESDKIFWSWWRSKTNSHSII